MHFWLMKIIFKSIYNHVAISWWSPKCGHVTQSAQGLIESRHIPIITLLQQVLNSASSNLSPTPVRMVVSLSKAENCLMSRGVKPFHWIRFLNRLVLWTLIHSTKATISFIISLCYGTPGDRGGGGTRILNWCPLLKGCIKQKLWAFKSRGSQVLCVCVVGGGGWLTSN